VQAIARHVAPVLGILFLGWSAQSVLLLYFADTLFAIAVMAAGVLRHFFPPPQDDGWATRLNGEVGAVGFGLLTAAIFVVPLGVPLFFMLMDFSPRAALSDPALRTGIAWQAVAALWSYEALYRELLVRTPEELGIKRRFGLVFLRWMLLVMIAGTGVGALLGRYGALLFVVLYAAISIWTDVAPDRFLRMVPDGVDEATAAQDRASGLAERRRARTRPKSRK
jgi:hypothetical protein